VGDTAKGRKGEWAKGRRGDTVGGARAWRAVGLAKAGSRIEDALSRRIVLSAAYLFWLVLNAAEPVPALATWRV